MFCFVLGFKYWNRLKIKLSYYKDVISNKELACVQDDNLLVGCGINF